MKKLILIFLIFIAFGSYSQAVNYDDVAVIINDNSPASVAIGQYFQSARNIPSENMIHISAPTTEEIDSAQFEAFLFQIEYYLTINGLADEINYIVTTKGVPLKVNYVALGLNDDGESFDALLSLRLGDYNPNGSFFIMNPFYNSGLPFSKDEFGFCMVTRLDSYTTQEVFDLIDRSGPMTPVNPNTSQAILDLSFLNASDSGYFLDNSIDPVYQELVTDWNVSVDSNNLPIQNLTDVLFLMKASFDTTTAFIPYNFDWTEASIGSLLSVKSASTFYDSLNIDNEVLVADIIAEGCTGALGYVGSYFFSQLPRVELLAENYLDTTIHYNLAESFYSSFPWLISRTVIIGDPKSSISIDNLASSEVYSLSEIRLSPNPSSGEIEIESNENILSLAIYSLNGKLVFECDDLQGKTIKLDLNHLQKGIYLIHVDTQSDDFRKKLVISD